MVSFHSRGRAFANSELDELFRIVKREEFIDLSLRDIPSFATDRTEITKQDLEMDECFPYDQFVASRNPFEALQAKTNPKDLPDEKLKDDFRKRRILQELDICRRARTYNVEFERGRFDRWVVRLQGPLSESIERMFLWPLIVDFPLDYPYSCPLFRFAAVPGLRNVWRSGRVVCSAISKYHPMVSIVALLRAIHELFRVRDEEAADECADEWTFERWKEEKLYGRIVPENMAGIPPEGTREAPDYHTSFSQLSCKYVPPEDVDDSTGLVLSRDETSLIE
jgi:ubiquitin-protein ligase